MVKPHLAANLLASLWKVRDSILIENRETLLADEGSYDLEFLESLFDQFKEEESSYSDADDKEETTPKQILLRKIIRNSCRDILQEIQEIKLKDPDDTNNSAQHNYSDKNHPQKKKQKQHQDNDGENSSKKVMTSFSLFDLLDKQKNDGDDTMRTRQHITASSIIKKYDSMMEKYTSSNDTPCDHKHVADTILEMIQKADYIQDLTNDVGGDHFQCETDDMDHDNKQTKWSQFVDILYNSCLSLLPDKSSNLIFYSPSSNQRHDQAMADNNTLLDLLQVHWTLFAACDLHAEGPLSHQHIHVIARYDLTCNIIRFILRIMDLTKQQPQQANDSSGNLIVSNVITLSITILHKMMIPFSRSVLPYISLQQQESFYSLLLFKFLSSTHDKLLILLFAHIDPYSEWFTIAIKQLSPFLLNDYLGRSGFLEKIQKRLVELQEESKNSRDPVCNYTSVNLQSTTEEEEMFTSTIQHSHLQESIFIQSLSFIKSILVVTKCWFPMYLLSAGEYSIDQKDVNSKTSHNLNIEQRITTQYENQISYHRQFYNNKSNNSFHDVMIKLIQPFLQVIKTLLHRDIHITATAIPDTRENESHQALSKLLYLCGDALNSIWRLFIYKGSRYGEENLDDIGEMLWFYSHMVDYICNRTNEDRLIYKTKQIASSKITLLAFSTLVKSSCGLLCIILQYCNDDKQTSVLLQQRDNKCFASLQTLLENTNQIINLTCNQESRMVLNCDDSKAAKEETLLYNFNLIADIIPLTKELVMKAQAQRTTEVITHDLDKLVKQNLSNFEMLSISGLDKEEESSYLLLTL